MFDKYDNWFSLVSIYYFKESIYNSFESLFFYIDWA